MNSEFWHERWREGRIGFHEGRVNNYLERHADSLAGRRRVLVPLCGKTEDLAFLAFCGHEVIGVELVENAARAFFTERSITPVVTQRGELTELSAPSITIFSGDIFATTAALLGPIDAVYDRAALIALPEDLRRRYVAHLRALLPARARVLLLTLEYDQTKMAGPPFSVLEPEVRSLYDGAEIEQLSDGPGPLLRPDAPPAHERCFAITL